MKQKRLWFIAVLLAISSAITMAMQSETALIWLLGKGVKIIPGEVTIQLIHGRLAGPIELKGLRYQHEATLINIESLQLDWQPIKLLAGIVDIHLLEVDQLDIHLSGSDKPATPRPGNIALPFDVKLANARLRNIRVLRDAQQAVMRILRIDIEALAKPKRLELISLNIELTNAQLGVSGQVGLHSPHPLELTTNWQWQTPGIPMLSGNGRLNGNLRQLKLTQVLQTPSAARLTAVIHQPLHKLSWQAQLHIDSTKLEQWITTTIKLQVAGNVQAEGGLEQFTWHGHINSAGPAVGKVESEFSGKYLSQVLQIEKLILQHTKYRTKFALNGHIDLHNKPTLAIQGDWQNMVWPLAGQPQFISPNGSYSLRGSLDQYHIKLYTTLQGPAIPPGHWQFAGNGHKKGLSLNILEAQTLNGQVSGKIELHWQPLMRWQLALTAKQLDPAVFWPLQHGRLSFSLFSEGQIKDGSVQTISRIDKLHGTLHEEPVSGSMQLDVTDNRYQLSRLKLSIGESNVQVSGHLSEKWDLQWQVRSSNLVVFSPQAGGQLDTKGRITGLRTMPRIQARVDGSKLVLNTFSAAAIQAEFDVDLTSQQPSRLHGHATNVSYANQVLDSLQIKANSLAQILSLDIQIQGKTLALNLRASGPFQAGRWRGQLIRADFNAPRLARWQLAAPGTFDVTRQNLRLDPVCWSADTARFCLSFEQPTKGSWRVALTGQQFPLALAEWFVPRDVQFTGLIDGKFNLTVKDHQFTGQANGRFSRGEIIYAPVGASKVRLTYLGGSLHLRQDDRLLKGGIKLKIDQTNHIQLGVTLPSLSMQTTSELSKQALTIRLQTRLDQLTFLSLFFPELIEPKGLFHADLTISGSAGQPRIDGYAKLQNVEASLPDLGITLQGLNLTTQAKNSTTVQLTGQARSSEGNLKLDGYWQLDPATGWPLQLNLQGKQFEMIRTTETWVLVSPNIKLRMAGQRIDIEGNVKIPRAKLEPVGLPEGVTVSRDTIVTGAGTGDDASHYKQWEIYSKVRISLGNDVQFNGFGLRGRLTGEVLAVDTPQTLTTGKGELVIHHGRYRVHGENLQVDPGRLIFAGGPIDDPGVDARALRRLDEVVAGVKVRGTLKAPKLILFSEPAMRESDILAYIVLGRPLDQTSHNEAKLLIGVSSLLNFTGSRGLNDQIATRFGLEEISLKPGATPEEGVSLVLGKYLSPRLYVSYMVGLMDATNTIHARYKLGKNVSLQGESSSSQSGADVLFTIER